MMLSKHNKALIQETRQLPNSQNPAAVYLASLRPTGRRTQERALRVVADILTHGASEDYLIIPWEKLGFQHTAAVKAVLESLYKPASTNKILCALRQTLKAAWRLGLMSHEDYARAADVQSVENTSLPAGRDVSPAELYALMQVCERDPSPAGVRDAAMIAVAYCGLRRDEISHLEIDNYTQESGELKIMHAKRNRQRLIYLADGAMHAMADWLTIRGYAPGALFCPINKGGHLTLRPMSNQVVYNVLEKRARECGIEHLSPHDMRRTSTGDMLDANVDIATVARFMGHANVNTTFRYDRRPDQAKKEAASRLHVPYKGREEKG
jgi:integrase